MLVIILLAGCSKDVLEENPPNILSGPTILKNYNGFEAALNGLYHLARYARWQSEKLENALNGVDNMTQQFQTKRYFLELDHIQQSFR